SYVGEARPERVGGVRCSDETDGRQRRASVEDADIVEAEEAALKNISAFGIFAIHPPGEVEQEFLEDAFQKQSVARATALFFNFVYTPCSPGVHRRVDVAEGPLIGGQLAVGMHVPLPRHQNELFLGEIRIN